jgi:hypothetical protein
LKRLFGALAVLAAFVAVPSTASAASFDFSCFSLNSATDCAILEAQMSVEITLSTEGDRLNFKFFNSGPDASYIDGLYFSDPPPSLLGGDPKFAYSNSGISFGVPCSPGDLPNNWGATYCADANSPKAADNGVHPTEWVQVSYLLQSPATLATVLAGIDAGTFDIGIKVQGFDGGGSEWGTVNKVPEPGTLALLASGLSLAALRRRRARA